MFDNVTILAVDDDPMNLEMIDVILSECECTLLKAENGIQAFSILNSNPHVDLVLLDLEMPLMNGYETLTGIKQSFEFREIPVIVVTVDADDVTKTLALGANDFIAKPYNPDELRLRAMNHVRSKKLADLAKDMNSILEKEVVKKTAALQKALKQSRDAEYEIALRLGRAAEFRDKDTGMHTRRISELSFHLAMIAGLDSEQCELIKKSSPLHDVGKIGIPDRVLLKPGKLETDEFEIMKEHTVIGGEILSDSDIYPTLYAGAVIAIQHHEKWDGSGYPHKLKGEDIHIFSRIVSLVDVFDALLTERPYKKAFSLEKTLTIMNKERGVTFDPRLFDLFVENCDQFVAIMNALKDEPVQLQ